MKISKGLIGLSGERLSFIREIISFSLGMYGCEFNTKNIDITMFEFGNSYTMNEIAEMDGDDILEKITVFIKSVKA